MDIGTHIDIGAQQNRAVIIFGPGQITCDRFCFVCAIALPVTVDGSIFRLFSAATTTRHIQAWRAVIQADLHNQSAFFALDG